jgi:hypothetical protein
MFAMLPAVLGSLTSPESRAGAEALGAPDCRWLGCRRRATHLVGWVVGGVGVAGSYCPPHAAAIRSASRLTEVWISSCWPAEQDQAGGLHDASSAKRGELVRVPF